MPHPAVAIHTITLAAAPHAGEEAVVMENAALRVVTLLRGAWVVSIVDKRTGREFIHVSEDGRNSQNGIFDRMDSNGRHSYSIKDNAEHFRNAIYAVEDAGGGRVRFVCALGKARIVRTLTLAGDSPRLSVEQTLTNVSRQPLRSQPFIFYQGNTGPDDVSYNDVVVFPHPRGERVTQFETFADDTPTEGWWYSLDRQSKHACVMFYAVGDPSVAQIYAYRAPQFFHCITFGREQVLAPGASAGIRSDFLFLVGPESLAEVASAATGLAATAAERLRQSLTAAMSVPPFDPTQPWPKTLPMADPAKVIAPPRATPLFTVFHVRNRLYADPAKLRAESWTSPTALAQVIAEANAVRPDLLVLSGVAAMGTDLEYAVMRRALSEARVPVRLLPEKTDAASEQYRLLGGEAAWVHEAGGLCLIGFSRGREAWLIETLARNKDKRVVLIGDHLPQDATDNLSVRLACVPQAASMSCFNRVGAWPVVSTPPLPGSGAYDVIHVYADGIEVTAGKPLGETFAPQLILAEPCVASPTAPGLPHFIHEKPLLAIAHIADTQLSDRSYESKYYGPARTDLANFRRAVEEINALKPDLCLNSGDLVNKGERDTEWALYAEIAAKVAVPYYEVLGNHDVDAMTVENTPLATRFRAHTGDREQYTIARNGVNIHVLGYATDYVGYLRQQRAGDVTLLAVHEPLPSLDDMDLALLAEIRRLNPLAVLAGHTHRLEWRMVGDVPQFIGSALGWTKTGDPAWNGYFIHYVYRSRIVSSFKRLGLDGLYFTTIVEQ